MMGAGELRQDSHSVRESLWMGAIVGMVPAALLANLARCCSTTSASTQAVADRAKPSCTSSASACRPSPATARCTATRTSINQTKPIMVIAILRPAVQHRRQLAAHVRQLRHLPNWARSAARYRPPAASG
jgi:hypothetical protein